MKQLKRDESLRHKVEVRSLEDSRNSQRGVEDWRWCCLIGLEIVLGDCGCRAHRCSVALCIPDINWEQLRRLKWAIKRGNTGEKKITVKRTGEGEKRERTPSLTVLRNTKDGK